ncbi:MAG: hypothetical protein KIT80_07555 [Chitinophagaceae bacterium]|nr:hypothetical protein [Chitinophagaceae bacterium]MCW5926748.1 hypothetical protein [Chitinophagaceae bacterium]
MKSSKRNIFLILLLFVSVPVFAQLPGRLGNLRNFGGGGGGGGRGGGDSLQFEKRDPFADSVSIRFKYLDTVRTYTFDSSLTDYYNRVPLKPEYMWLGNNGNAAKSLLFNPIMRAGWDPGFHAFDIYGFRTEDTRFFTTTRPFTELGYQLGSRQEQMINVVHTQNIRPNWNFAFQFRLINSPGFFKSQNANHSSLRFNTNYQSPNKRYNLYLIALRNSLQSAENGGIANDTFITSKATTSYYDRFTIPINTSNSSLRSMDVFNTALKTGNRYTDFNFLLRQQYDFGKKDSVVTDSSVIKLFYPRFRFEHTVQYNSYGYLFQDVDPDSAFYRKNYDMLLSYTTVPFPPVEIDTVRFSQKWTELINDISIYSFPDIKNQQQFLRVGAAAQNLATQWNGLVQDRPFNFFLHGEYRNRTRNRKWDIELNGQMHIAGFNAGDYQAYLSLQRQISRKIGFLQLGFQNTNRTPSYLMRNATGYPVVTPPDGTNKENITHIFGNLDLPALKMSLSGHYFLVGNYTYFKNFTEVEQSSVFNVLQIKASKDFPISRHWHWYIDVVAQQTAGNTPVNLPLLYTRNRLVFQGRFFKNLNIATGLDSRYYTAYTPDNYSPVTGQFFPQKEVRVSNLPDIAAFLHFRIRSFTAYLRAENLNTVDVNRGFSFLNNNFAAPLYPYAGFFYRFGIFWNFVN